MASNHQRIGDTQMAEIEPTPDTAALKPPAKDRSAAARAQRYRRRKRERFLAQTKTYLGADYHEAFAAFLVKSGSRGAGRTPFAPRVSAKSAEQLRLSRRR
jgi:hypothetical protein